MSPFPSGSVPRAGVDPITTDATARSLVTALCRPPCRDAVMVVTLDARHCGLGILRVADNGDPRMLLGVAQYIARIRSSRCAAVVLVSSRRHRSVWPGDVDVWLELSEMFDDGEIDLREWYVASRAGGIECPRDLFGEPPRWRQ